MARKEKAVLEKKGWSNSFVLVGEAKINADYTYKLDEHSEKSDWVYNSLNLGAEGRRRRCRFHQDHDDRTSGF